MANTKPETKRITLSLSPDVIEYFQARANDNKRTLSAQIDVDLEGLQEQLYNEAMNGSAKVGRGGRKSNGK